MSRASVNLHDLANEGRTFADLIRKVARVRGFAPEDGVNDGLPEDPDDLVRVKDAINLGYQRFLVEHDWTFLRPRVQIEMAPNGDGPFNVDDDPARYRLPLGIEGAPQTDFAYLDNESLLRAVTRTDFQHIRELHASAIDATGFPQYVATAPLAATQDDDVHGWQVMVWPAPQAAYRLEAEFFIVPPDMEALTDRPWGGRTHDLTIYYAAISELRRQDDPNQAAAQRDEAMYQQQLQRSIQRDLENRPTSVGSFRDPSIGSTMRRDDALLISYAGVTMVSGQAIQ